MSANKYHWVRTTRSTLGLRGRLEGPTHLCREEVRTYDDGTPYVSGGTPVRGATPWAYSGPGDDDPNKCAWCLTFEKTLKQEN